MIKNLIPMHLQFFADGEATDNAVESNNEGVTEQPTITEKQLKARLARQEKDFQKRLDAEIAEAKDLAVQSYIKQQDEDKKLKRMNETERLQAQIEKLTAEKEELKTQQQLFSMKETARNELMADGLSVPNNVLDLIVSQSADDTTQNMATIREWVDELKASWEKERATGTTPKASDSQSHDVDPFAQLRQKYQ